MPELEKSIERKACRWAIEAGWLCYKFASPSHTSVPDRIFAKGGRVVFIEFKRPGGKLTSGQEREINRMQIAGLKVHIAYSVEDVQRILNPDPGET